MAAGVGSRLDPITKDIPKPLVPILNKPVMDILLEKLKQQGISEVIANTYYLAEQIQERYTKNSPVDISFNYIHEVELSGTAGGVKKCEFFFQDVENFLVVSADGLHDADLGKIVQSHIDSKCIATMAIIAIEPEEVSQYGVVVPSKENTVIEFQEKPAVEEAKSNYINTGIYVFNKRIFDFIPKNEKYDFAKNVFPSLLEAGEKINVFEIFSYWSDIGTIEQYIQSNIDSLSKKVNAMQNNIEKTENYILKSGENCTIDNSCTFKNNVVIGDNCVIGKNVVLDNVIFLNNVVVKDDVILKNVVCANNTIIENSILEKEEWSIVASSLK